MNVRKRNSIRVFVLFLITLTSCLKEELPVPKHKPGDMQVNEIAMTQDYRNQLYFDLGTNKVVKSNLKTEWDLAFASTENYVLINSAKGMAVHRSTADFETITSAEDLTWNWDVSSGNTDSTAIGNWLENDFVYVINSGYDWLGDHQGYSKLEILNVSESSFEIKYASLSEGTPTTYIINKSNTTQYTYFSLVDGVVEIAPTDTEYDLIFTQYTHLFKEPLTPYLVTGVILNRGYTTIARLDEKKFEDIKLSDTESLIFNKNLDAIGYNWKYYSLEDGIFTTHSNKNYIIKTQDGVLYKFRFTGFYNNEGLKGYPNIEFQAL